MTQIAVSINHYARGNVNVAKDVETRLQQDTQDYETDNTGIEDGDDIETSPRDKQQKYRSNKGNLLDVSSLLKKFEKNYF